MADDTLSLPVVLGTARQHRKSERAAHFLVQMLQDRDAGVAPQLVDVREHVQAAVTVPPWGEGGANENPTEWQRIASTADGFVLVVPEYNHGYPGELKLLMDALYEEFKNKPVAICGVSAGGWGGTRVVEHIKPICLEFGLVPTKASGYFPKVGDALGEDGTPNDAGMAEHYADLCDELIANARHLRTFRANR